MPTGYLCPLCRATIPPDDVNVATDIVLCRACGKTSAFSMITGATSIDPNILLQPPRGVRIEQDFSRGRVISYRRLNPALFFLIPFTAFWSGLSMWGIYGTQFVKGKFELGQSLFGIPFLVGTIVLLSVILFMLFGKWRITLRQGMGTVFIGVGSLGWNRSFTYDRNTRISLRMTNLRVNGVPQSAILIQTGEQDFVFGTLLKSEAKQFIAAAILREAKQG